MILEVLPELQTRPDALEQHLRQIAAHRPAGAASRPSHAGHRADTFLSINHQGQFPSVTLTFNLAPGVALGEAVQAIKKAEAELGMPALADGQLPGQRPGVPGLARKRAAPDRGGARRRLHHSRHAL